MFLRRLICKRLQSCSASHCRGPPSAAAAKLAFRKDAASAKFAETSTGTRCISGTSARFAEDVLVSRTKKTAASAANATDEKATGGKVVLPACGDIDEDDLSDDEEEEEMFVDAHVSFEHSMVEWGGPRRGGRLPEPTRFGDWERKGRCTDF